MKFVSADGTPQEWEVTLHVRVWIEITISDNSIYFIVVTLHVRVWIEISY